MLKKQANKSIMYEYTCFQQQHYKEKQETCQDIQYLNPGSVTFLEENGDRDWLLEKNVCFAFNLACSKNVN